MKRKELKNLATKIAKAEQKRASATSEEEKKNFEQEIFFLSGKVTNINDMLLLDDMIQEIIENNLDF